MGSEGSPYPMPGPQQTWAPNPPNQRPQHAEPAPRRPLTLTPEEKRVLRECGTESFWYRCVPLSILFVGGTQMMVNRGILNPHPKYGSLFKNMGAALIAYLAGRFSYQGECMKKLLALEHSPLADSIRSGKQGSPIMPEMYPIQGDGDHQPAPTMQYPKKLGEYQDTMEMSDGNKQSEGIDDSQRPSMDSDDTRQITNNKEQQYINYEDLRQMNRKSAQKMYTPPNQQGSGEGQYITTPNANYSPPPVYNQPPPKQYRPKVNKYGDLIEE